MRMNGLLIGMLSGLVFTACGMSAGETDGTERPSESQSELNSLYPTTWTLTNSTTQALTFNCTCPKPTGLINPINMTPTTVSAGQSTILTWSSYYNDGLGLNAGRWYCNVTAGGSVYATTNFFISWGQSITLNALPGGQLVMQ